MYEVRMTTDAARDLETLYDHIHLHDGVEKASHVLGAITDVVESLSEFPERGSYLRELQGLDAKIYREVFFKRYRVIYRVQQKNVFIFLIADGRRDFPTLLMERLLR